jgi:hypothetical protein
MGCKHIVQLREQLVPSLEDLDDSDEDVHPPEIYGKLTMGVTHGFFLMEELRRGSLGKVIERAATTGTRISNRTVWLIFEKLFRMVVATRYPVQWWADFDIANPAEREETIPVNMHRAPALTVVDAHGNRISPPQAIPGAPVYLSAGHMNDLLRRIVHLDVDPSNIFVGDYAPADRNIGHGQQIPQLKVRTLSAQIKDLEAELW